MMAHRLAPDSPPSTDFALFVHKSPAGAHVGVVYRAANSHRLLHQAWHCSSRDEELAEYVRCADMPLLWVPPGLNEDEQADLRTHSVLVAQHFKDGGIPYAFQARNASISPQGNVNLGESLGLTCATFVMRLFAAARVHLLLEDSWEPGQAAEK
jgi:hypothetical protein